MARSVSQGDCTALHESGKAVQTPLFEITALDALAHCVNSAGGPKRVGGLLWPHDPVARSEARVRAVLNPERPDKFSIEEMMAVVRAAREAGDHSFMQFFCRELGYECKPIPLAEVKRKAKKTRTAALLAELARLMEDE
jgi:hypothetical protein